MQRRRPLPDRPVRSAGAPMTDPESEQEPEPEPEQFAPEFELGTREVFAVEHPAIIQNLDNGIKTFGRDQPFERVSLSRFLSLKSRDLRNPAPSPVLISPLRS
jgi:hypothetical protein